MTTWEIVEPGRQATTAWAGGKTTELYIYPRDTLYADRQFGFRVSSATVELEQSEFTPLPGFTRHIMPLRGQMRLEHEGHHTRALTPYEVDVFDGGWRTLSRGKCTDFNLMFGSRWTGRLYALNLPGSIDCSAGSFTGLYALDDAGILISGPGRQPEAMTLEAGAFLMLHHDENDAPVQIAVEAGHGEGEAPPVIVAACRHTGNEI